LNKWSKGAVLIQLVVCADNGSHSASELDGKAGGQRLVVACVVQAP
jgi:hypothetical protein